MAFVPGFAGIILPEAQGKALSTHGPSRPNSPLALSSTHSSDGTAVSCTNSMDSSTSDSKSTAATSVGTSGAGHFHDFLGSPSKILGGPRKARSSSASDPSPPHSSVFRHHTESISSVVLATSPDVASEVPLEVATFFPENTLLDGGVTCQPPIPMDVLSLPLEVEDLTGKIERVEKGETRLGGYSNVYEGRNMVTGESIAIKCLRATEMDNMDSTSPEGKERLRKRLFRELRVLRLVPHPRVSRLLGYADFGGEPALITQWYREGNLSEYLLKHPQASKPRLISQVGQGLTHLHFHVPPIAHSDVKPANILIDAIGDAALSDFGLAKLLDGIRTGLTTKNDPGYSVRYCAPEMLEGGAGTPAADVYAFACLTFEVLTGRLPFYEHTSYQTLIMTKSKKMLPSRWICPELPDGVWLLLVRCWSPEPKSRPDMMELMHEFTGLGWGEAGSVLPHGSKRARTA